MKSNKKDNITLWIKRLLGLLTFIVWSYIIYSISTSNLSFNEQAPYCMGSTMIIFTLLSFAFKGLEYWEKKS